MASDIYGCIRYTRKKTNTHKSVSEPAIFWRFSVVEVIEDIYICIASVVGFGVGRKYVSNIELAIIYLGKNCPPN